MLTNLGRWKHLPIFFFGAMLFAQRPALEMRDGVFRVNGWQGSATDLAAIFEVYASDGDVPPMLGDYSREGDAIIFRPRFPLAAGVKYRATFHPAGAAPLEERFDGLKRETTPVTRVAHIYPSSLELPSNSLKLYIYFTAPMARGDAWRHIHLLNADGTPVSLPFLEIDQELWDPGNQRLTVLFDPGRIKRGLVPREEVGPAIVEGKKYTLVVDRDWLDARGVALVEGFRKPISGVPADRIAPEVSRWRITAPRAGNTQPLVVNFDEPMDYALLQRLINVQDVSGTITVEQEERQWRFTPDAAWKPGSYELVVDTTLEDMAGNHIGRLFDVDVFEKITEKLSRKTVSVPFQIK